MNVIDKDLSVLEEDKPQVITKLQFEKDTPVSLGVLIDVSRGMGPEGINLALSWLKTLAETLKSPDEIFVNAFSDESQEVVDYISPEDYLGEALDHLGTGGQARMGLAVDPGTHQAARRQKQEEGTVVVLSRQRHCWTSDFGPYFKIWVPNLLRRNARKFWCYRNLRQAEEPKSERICAEGLF